MARIKSGKCYNFSLTDSDLRDDSLRISQRGRVIKPRLSFWLGERIVYDCYGTPLKVEGITTDNELPVGGRNQNATFLPSSSESSGREGLLSSSVKDPTNKDNWRVKRLVDYSDTSSSVEEDSDGATVEVLTPLHVRKKKGFSRSISSSPESNLRPRRPDIYGKKNHNRTLKNKAEGTNRRKGYVTPEEQLAEVYDESPDYNKCVDIESEVSFTDYDYSSDEKCASRGQRMEGKKKGKFKSRCSDFKLDGQGSSAKEFCRHLISEKQAKYFSDLSTDNNQLPANSFRESGSLDDTSGNLQISRSGRVIRPRLASWCGQRSACNANGSPSKGFQPQSSLSADEFRLRTPSFQRTSDKSRLRTPNVTKKFTDNFENTNCSLERSLTPLHCHRIKNRLRQIDSSDESEKSSPTKGLTRRRRRIKKHDWRVDKKQAKKSVMLKSKSEPSFKKKRLKARKKKCKVESPKDTETSGPESVLPSGLYTEADVCTSSNTAFAAPRRWKKEELERLKLALNSIKPSSSDDWERVAVAIGGGRSSVECHENALKKLNYQEKIIDDNENETELKECAGALFKAKIGSLSYLVHAQRFTRKFLMNEAQVSKSPKEAFDYNTIAEMPSVAHFDPDDSLLEVLRTPKLCEVRKANHREFLPKLPNNSYSQTSGSSLTPEEAEWKERDRKQRYVHHMLRSRRNGLCNKSTVLSTNKLNLSTGNPEILLRDAVKKLKKSRNKSSEFEEEDEELVSDGDEENVSIGTSV